MNNNFIAISNIYSKCWHVDRQLINFECIFIKIAKMPCSQIESVKMIMLQVASNHFSISRMPIFAPHIFLFPIKQSWRGNNDHYPWPFDHFSVDLRNIIQKHQRRWLKLPLIFPMHCIKNSFIQSPVSSLWLGPKVTWSRTINREPRIWRHSAHSFLGFLASNNKTADYRENIRCVVFYDGL